MCSVTVTVTVTVGFHPTANMEALFNNDKNKGQYTVLDWTFGGKYEVEQWKSLNLRAARGWSVKII